MAYCQKCGNEKEYPYGKCPTCGHMPTHPDQQRKMVVDEGGFLWGLLGFCVPVVGLLLYLIWKDERPNTALAAGKGALAYVILTIVGTILYFIFIFIFIGVSGAL